MAFKKNGNELWHLFLNQKMSVRFQVKEALERISVEKDYYRAFSRHYSKAEYEAERTPYIVIEILIKYCIPRHFNVSEMPLARIKAWNNNIFAEESVLPTN